MHMTLQGLHVVQELWTDCLHVEAAMMQSEEVLPPLGHGLAEGELGKDRLHQCIIV